MSGSRIQRLAARVHWCDRYRRRIAIAVALIVAPIAIARLDSALAHDWRWLHAVVLGAMLASVIWWVVEVGFAWLAALWETEYDRLIRDRGLPLARLIRRRKTG